MGYKIVCLQSNQKLVQLLTKINNQKQKLSINNQHPRDNQKMKQSKIYYRQFTKTMNKNQKNHQRQKLTSNNKQYTIMNQQRSWNKIQ